MVRIWSLSAIFAATPFSILLSSGYRTNSFEPWLVTAVFAGFGFVVGCLVHRKTWAFSIAFFLAAFWFLDANIYEQGWFIGLSCLVVLFGFLFFMRQIEEWAVPAAATFAILFSATALVKPHAPTLVWSGSQDIASAGPERPALMHIVLDEFMSPLAMPDTIPAGHPAQSILDQLVADGFRVNSSAQSISDQTYESVSATVGMNDRLNNFLKTPGSDFSFSVTDPQIFERLAMAGYGISVIQTNYLDLCLGNPELRCATYSRAANMEVFARMNVGWALRTQLAFLALDFKLLPDYGYFSRPMVVLELLNDMAAGTYSPAPGQAIFTHLMLPHFPYILANDCSLKPIKDWTYPARRYRNADLERIYKGYWDQVGCVLSRLELILMQTKDDPNLTIVLHGDHGSRISAKTIFENTDDLMLTFFAARGPGIEAGRSDQKVVLQNASRQFYIQFLGSELR